MIISIEVPALIEISNSVVVFSLHIPLDKTIVHKICTVLIIKFNIIMNTTPTFINVIVSVTYSTR